MSDRGQSWLRGPYPVSLVTQVLDQNSTPLYQAAVTRRVGGARESKSGAQRSAKDRRGTQNVTPQFTCCLKVRNKHQSFLGYPGSTTLFQRKNKTHSSRSG
ncbi:unnamed protein product [Gadus morhua 'NCC']